MLLVLFMITLWWAKQVTGTVMSSTQVTFWELDSPSKDKIEPEQLAISPDGKKSRFNLFLFPNTTVLNTY